MGKLTNATLLPSSLLLKTIAACAHWLTAYSTSTVGGTSTANDRLVSLVGRCSGTLLWSCSRDVMAVDKSVQQRQRHVWRSHVPWNIMSRIRLKLPKPSDETGPL